MKADDWTINLGFKALTLENWAEPDLPKCFSFLRERDWMEAVLKPKLNPGVPKDVQALYEVARGAFVYGWLFYPLMTLGVEQCFRVSEAALAAKCQELGLPVPKVPGFHAYLSLLVRAKTILEKDVPDWESCRKLRNMSSHPDMQGILPPGMALPVLQNTAERINRLFP